MKKILTALILVFGSAVFLTASAQSDTNRTDNNGKKTGIWKEKNGQTDHYGSYENDLKEGLWVGYHINGIAASIEEFRKGKKNGHSFQIDKTGMYFQKDYYVNDTLHGLSTTYYPGAKVRAESTFKMGILHGVKRSFYNDGKLQEEGYYQNGLRHGVSKWFYPEGQLSIRYNYKNGNLDGEQKSFYRNGNLNSEGRSVNNLEDGEYFEYFENGKLKISGKYQAGKKQGAWKEFDADGKLLKKEVFKNGELKK